MVEERDYAGRITDLKVSIQEHRIIVPPEPTPRDQILFLSNLDQVVLYPIETIYIFPAKGSTESTVCVADRLGRALEKLLVPYYFMAGRLKINSSQNRLELKCNNAGVPFAGASSELTFDELGDLTHVTPAFSSLLLQFQHPESLSDLPLISVQVTRFKCGGFTLGFTSNHTLLDGIAAGDFLSNYASFARGDGLIVTPKPDRTALQARCPPEVKFEHVEYAWLPGTPYSKQEQPAAYTEQEALEAATSKGKALEDHTYRMFKVSGKALGRLKELGRGRERSCTGFEALAAHLWRCKTAAMEMESGEYSSLLFAVDIRKRMEPSLPEGFAGNAVLSACARARAGELVEKPLWFAVQKVQEARALITHEYVRSAIDCLESHKGVPLGSSGCYVSAWWKIPFHTLDFGWGRPCHAGPVVSSMVEFVLFISDGSPDGLNVLLAFHTPLLLKFEPLFLHHL